MHEVCSYTLTKVGGGDWPDSPAASRTGTERRSETSDEWVDEVSDADEPSWTVVRHTEAHPTASHDPL